MSIRNNKEISRFIATLNLLKFQAGKLGLYRTMHKIDSATKEVGWEVAEHIEKEDRNPRTG